MEWVITSKGSGNEMPFASKEAAEDFVRDNHDYFEKFPMGEIAHRPGTSNYVIFREEDIEITHKNGEPVTPAERKEATGGNPAPGKSDVRFMPSDHEDAITDAAIRMHDTGKIYTGFGHTMAMVAAEERYPSIFSENGPTFDEGFVTKTGIFLSRGQAHTHAKKIGQVAEKAAVGLSGNRDAMESRRFHDAARFMPEPDASDDILRKNDNWTQTAFLAMRTLQRKQPIGTIGNDETNPKSLAEMKEWRYDHPDAKAAAESYPLPHGFLKRDRFSESVQHSDNLSASLATFEKL